MSGGRPIAIGSRSRTGKADSALHATLLYLETEARTLRLPLAALLVGAAADALVRSGLVARALRPMPELCCSQDADGDVVAGLARCLSLVRDELRRLPDPTPRRFVDAAILSLVEAPPAAPQGRPSDRASSSATFH